MSYRETMKNAVRAYRAEAVKALEQITEVKNLYKENHAADTVEAIKAQLDKKKQEAMAKIEDARRQAVDSIKEWGKLDGKQITADAELLKYELTPADFDNLVERYQGNATMSRLLMAYGDKANKNAMTQDGDIRNVFNLANIDTPERRTHEAETMSRTAVGILDALDVERGYMRGVDSPMVGAMVDNFLKE